MKTLALSANRLRKPRATFYALCAFSILAFASCSQGKHTSNPRLRQIDDMLDAQLHPGATKARVTVYLNSQGFLIENSDDPQTVVAIVKHVDIGTLQPETARVTFHFDAKDKLLSYELVPASGPLSRR
jgi:ATP-dependent 26S proteasome regulatory subunit